MYMDYKKFRTKFYQKLDSELNKDPGIMSFSDSYLVVTITEMILESFEVNDREKIKPQIIRDTRIWVLAQKGVCNHQLGKRYERTEKSRGDSETI